jgi:ubiquinone/menaquinone biosynthesis C-methylase UbiE
MSLLDKMSRKVPHHKRYLDKKEEWENTKYSDEFISKKGRCIDKLEKDAFYELCNQEEIFENVVEIGIGNGRLIPTYKGLTNKLYGVDISMNLLSEVKKHAVGNSVQCRTVCATAEKLPFNTETFDLIINSRMLQHCLDWKIALESICSVSKRDSTFILMVYNMFSLFGFIRYFHNFYANLIDCLLNKNKTNIRKKFKGHFNNIYDIRRELKKNGFIIVKCKGAVFFPVEKISEAKLEKHDILITKVIHAFERISAIWPFKYFCGRLLILAIRKDVI